MLIVESLSAIHLTADRSGTAGDEWRLKGKKIPAKTVRISKKCISPSF
jgi:hypothetical protein